MIKNIEDTKLFAEKYFSFLVTDYGFDKLAEYAVGYEYHIKYRKDAIEIDIAVEADGTSLPWVILTNYNQPEMPSTTANYFPIEQLEDNRIIKDIQRNRGERRNPKVARFIKEIRSDNNFDKIHAPLDTDYEMWGKKELETILSESAGIIKRHAHILNGDLSTYIK